jgi:hypothetical protein
MTYEQRRRNNVKKSFIFLILLLLILPIVGVEAADDLKKNRSADFNFEPRIITGIMYYQYDERYRNSDDVEWSDNMPFLGIGGRLGLNNFSVNGYAQWSDTGVDSFYGVDDSFERDHNANFSRQDYAINLSYSIDRLFNRHLGLLSVFIGYKVGRTRIGGTRRYFLVNQENRIRFNEETDIKTKGPTIGIAYGWPIGESSVLGIKVARAMLEGDYDSNLQTVTIKPHGWTFGLNWSAPITNRLTYRLSLDGYSYPMSVEVSTGPEQLYSSIYEIEETVVSFKASLSYMFDF